MKKQTFTKYMLVRLEFSLAVGLFMEFDHETKLVSDFPEPRQESECIEIISQVLKFESPKNEDISDISFKGELSFPCMQYAKLFRQSPASIAERLKPYVDHWDSLDKVEINGGYLNMFYDRVRFLNEQMSFHYDN